MADDRPPVWLDAGPPLTEQDAPPADEVGAHRKRKAPPPPAATPLPALSQKLQRNARGQLRSTPGNLCAILAEDPRWEGVLAWNELAAKPEALRPPPWQPDVAPRGGAAAGPLSDEDATRMQVWFEREWDLTPNLDATQRALTVACRRRTFHPVQDYLRGLRWDGRARVDTWLVRYTGAPDSPYVRLVGRLWLISAVARAFQPGCLAKYLLSLEGPQDIQKSRLCRILGSPWFKDTPLDLGNKDALVGLRAQWIIELAEVDALTRGEQARLKGFISSPVDTYRPPFARSDYSFPRSSVFIATINPGGTGYLHDPTGNVRFWPVTCARIDAEALQSDRDQIWAEAAALLQEGARWWPETDYEKELCKVEQEARYQVDAREEAIALWLASSAGRSAESTDDLTTLRLLEQALKMRPDRIDRASQIAVGHAMHRLGYTRERQGAGSRLWVYRRARAQPAAETPAPAQQILPEPDPAPWLSDGPPLTDDDVR